MNQPNFILKEALIESLGQLLCIRYWTKKDEQNTEHFYEMQHHARNTPRILGSRRKGHLDSFRVKHLIGGDTSFDFFQKRSKINLRPKC